MFVDIVSIDAKAGDGGDGKLSFRHEKYIEKGGPDGGDGGKGGDVIFKATTNKDTLSEFRYTKKIAATNGQPGDQNKKRGKSGINLFVELPVGTTIVDEETQEILADLTVNGQTETVLNGGGGGFGNAHFKSSTRQAPRLAEKGEKGDTKRLIFEMRMVADVGLIGMPNAGKSTLLSVVSKAKPEIANYPFTTTTPNLGVADTDGTALLIADIPGLIEGASKGKGLGGEFLRHVSRCNVLLHLIDSTDPEIDRTYTVINNELKEYGQGLDKKPQIIALTKQELVDDEIIKMQKDLLKKVVPKSTKIMAISAQTHQGIKEALHESAKYVKKANKQLADAKEAKEQELPVITLQPKDDDWQITIDEDGNYVVSGVKIERFAKRTNFEQNDGVARLRDILRRNGILHELVKQGIEPGKKIIFGNPPNGEIEY